MSSMTDPKKCSNKKPSLGELDLTAVEHRTDNQLATSFVDRCHESVRFVTSWNKWLVWDGRRWQVDDTGALVLRLARGFAQSLWDPFTDLAKRGIGRDELSTLRCFCSKSNGNGGIVAFLNLARSDFRIAIHHEQLNSQVNLINFMNGTLDLNDGELYPHSQDHHLTQLSPVKFDAKAACPKWLETINLVFDGNQELIRYVQQLLGYSISGECGEAILPICYGSGCNGKSTIWNTITGVLGADYAGTVNSSLLLGRRHDGHPTELAQLYGQRFVAVSEPEAGARLKESLVKELTGDSVIKARRMREDFWQFKRTHMFWMASNHLPRIVGDDQGIWRRVKLIPFTVDIRNKTKPIPNLHDWFIENEGSGILNWLIEGYRDYRKNGFAEPECVKVATKDYRHQEDELEQFLAETCIVEPGRVCKAVELYNAYRNWGGKMSKVMFGKTMKSRFDWDEPTAGVYRRKVIYLGLELSPKEEY